jgi:kinesin family protein 1
MLLYQFLFYLLQFNVIVTHSFVDYLRTKPIVFEVMGHYQEHTSPAQNR